MNDLDAANDGRAPDSEGAGRGESILAASRERLKAAIEAESEERAKMADDMRFVALDQWPDDVRNARQSDAVNGARPCLTIDQINQYTTQVSNDLRRNRPSIKVRPVDDAADPKTAKIFQGLIRHIEDRSNAAVAYQTAGESAVDIGLGFFRITTEYVGADTFDQEILIKRLPNTFCVYLGPHVMPDGSDAEYGFIFEEVPLEVFRREYPGKKTEDADFAGLGVQPVWKTEDSITVCEYFYRDYEPLELLFLADGRSMAEDDYRALDEPRPEVTGRRRESRARVKWCKHTGAEILEERDWAGKYIPIVEEVGKEKIVGGRRRLWGLVRPAKDSLRAFNYWVSALTEKMALAPKAPWVGAVGQFATHGEKWDKANVNNYAKLEYDPLDVNGNPLPAPRRSEPMQMEPAMAQMLSIMQNNVKSSLGMYKAAIGESESQQSGRAILALQRESDTGTLHFGDNQAISIAHAGRIIVDLAPRIYDRRRVQRILGEDGREENVTLNPDQAEAVREIPRADGSIERIYNLGVGTYDVTVTTGPGYATSRQEAATVLTELANAAKDPLRSAILSYAAVKNSDFHDSEEVARMLKAVLPPQLQSTEGGGAEPVPAAALAHIGRLTEGAKALQAQAQALAAENQTLKTGAAADMAKVNADHDAKMKAVDLDRLVESKRANLARERFEFEKWLQTQKADHEIAMKRRADEFERECRMKDEEAGRIQEERRQAAPLMENMVPAFMEGMKRITEVFMTALEEQRRVNTALIEQMTKPKTVSLQGLRRDAGGALTGGTATVQ